LLLLAAAATFLMLRPSSLLWETLPKLRFVQFPWRWMSTLALPFAYFLGSALARSRLRWLWMAVVVAILAGTATFFVRQTWWDADDIDTIRADIDQGDGFDGTDEYDPAGDDHYNLPAKAPRALILPADAAAQAPAAKISFDRWTAEDKEMRVVLGAPAKLSLRLLNYPAWRVEINGSVVAPDSAPDSRQIVLDLPAGGSRVTARFVRTTDRTVGSILSVFSLLLALTLLVLPFP
jgi:hypothetical protein